MSHVNQTEYAQLLYLSFEDGIYPFFYKLRVLTEFSNMLFVVMIDVCCVTEINSVFSYFTEFNPLFQSFFMFYSYLAVKFSLSKLRYTYSAFGLDGFSLNVSFSLFTF